MTTELLWTDAVPTGWSVCRAKFLFRRMQRPVRASDGVVTAFRDGQVTLRAKRREDGFTFAEKEIGYQGVRAGDLVIHAMDGFAGAIGVSDSDGKCSPVCSVCLPSAEGIDPRYFSAVLRNLALGGFITSLAKGIRERSTDFRFNEFKEVSLLVPPVDQQRAIVAFLACKTAAIDALVARKARLMTLLQEKRQALITEAVTNGLDIRAPMKTSGLPWLAAIPAGWSLFRLKQLSHRISGRLVYQPAQYFSDEGVPFIMGNNVTERGISLEETRFVPPEVNARFAHHALHEGDVVMVRVGAPGVTAVVGPEAEGLNCGSLMIVRRNPAFHSPWLAAVMNSPVVRTQIDLVQYGAAQEQININDAVNFWIPTPPREEQERIAEFVTQATGQLDQTTDKVHEQIARLREYRQTLIASAVTGKLRLPAEAA